MASENLFETECSEEAITPLVFNRSDHSNAQSDKIVNRDTANKINSAEKHIEIEDNTENEILEQQSEESSEAQLKLFHLPLTRIRNLMKLDPDLNIASNEAVFAITRATELFVESLAQESYIFTVQAKKKTIQKRDVEMAISAVDCLMFLDGAMSF